MIGVARRTPVHGVRLSLYASLALAVASVVACTPQDTPTGLTEASPPVVVPRGAVLDVGASGPGVDDGVPFFAFTSDLVPEQTRASYAADLAAAGFTGQDDGDGWTTYTRGSERLQVRIGDAGPPTSIIVKIVSPGAGVTDRIAHPATTTAAVLPSTTPEATDASPDAVGIPDPPHGAIQTASTGANGQGNGGGQGQGNGQGNGNAPSATPGPVSSPVATATPAPPPTPKPTRIPKPTKTPKPTPKPTRTPNPGEGGGGNPGNGNGGNPGNGNGGPGGGG